MILATRTQERVNLREQVRRSLTLCWMRACLCSSSLFSMAESMTSWSSCTGQSNRDRTVNEAGEAES